MINKFLFENFKGTKIYYLYIDGLLKYRKINKETFFDNVNIPYSTYRYNRGLNNSKLDYHKTICEFMSVDLNHISLLDAENIINSVYKAIYFRNVPILEDYYIEINKYLENENLFRPIFLLFKIFISLVLNKKIKEIEELLSYIKSYPQSYYGDNFYFVLLLVEKCLNKDLNFSEIDKMLILNQSQKWLYYLIKANIYYFKREYNKSIFYYTGLLDIMKDENNQTRIINTERNLSIIYNLVGEYQLSLDFSSKYIESSLVNVDSSISTIINFVYSSFMLNMYRNIIYVIPFLNKKTKFTNIFIFIIYYLENICDYKEENIVINKGECYLEEINNMNKKYNYLKELEYRNVHEEYIYQIIKKIRSRQ